MRHNKGNPGMFDPGCMQPEKVCVAGHEYASSRSRILYVIMVCSLAQPYFRGCGDIYCILA